MTNITTGRRLIPPLACSDNQLREHVSRIGQVLTNTLGGPGPAGRDHPPISANTIPTLFSTWGELISDFGAPDANNVRHTQARVLDRFALNPLPMPSSSPPPPGGSPEAPAVIPICIPGWLLDAMATAFGYTPGRGSRGMFFWFFECWWPPFMLGPPGGGSQNYWSFEDPLCLLCDSGPGGVDGTGVPDNPTHSSPHSGKYICFTSGFVDHWAYWGTGGALAKENWSQAFWFKSAHVNGSVNIVEKMTNAGVAHEWRIFTDVTNERFGFEWQFLDSGGFTTTSGVVHSDNGTWDDDAWHFVTVSMESDTSGGAAAPKGTITIDGARWSFTSATPFSGDETPQTSGHFHANAATVAPTLGVTTGKATYCLDEYRFWVDRVLTDEEVSSMYNGGVISP